MKTVRVICLSIFALWALPAPGADLDLNEFFFDETVEVAPDGSTAVLQENPFFAFVLLSLDPGLGDPNLIIPGPNVELLFDYEVDLPASAGGDLLNDDRFTAFLFDASTGDGLGGVLEFATTSNTMGEGSFDLSSFTGRTLGLQFLLEALPGDIGLNSTATISNLRLEMMTTEPGTGIPTIPEPSSAVLLISGIALAGWMRRFL